MDFVPEAKMGRFYFDVRIGGQPTLVDVEGLELADIDAAQNKLVETATALARYEQNPESKELTVFVTVRDDCAARPVMKGTLVLRVAHTT
jgi:hypothetical protein